MRQSNIPGRIRLLTASVQKGPLVIGSLMALLALGAVSAAHAIDANVTVTKTDGVTTVDAGDPVHYVIQVQNLDAVINEIDAEFKDSLPAQLINCSWTCAASGGATCTAAGTGSIQDTIDLPTGSGLQYDLYCTVAPTATGSVSNKAMVHQQAEGAPVAATDTDVILVKADLAITKTDNATQVFAGADTTYEIVVTNNGPSSAVGPTVADVFPSECANVSYTSSVTGAATGNTAAGTGAILDVVNMPPSSTITYEAVCTVSTSASGTLSNTATVAAPAGVDDEDLLNNTATDNDTAIAYSADVQVTKDDGTGGVAPGGTVTYTIVASNAGPSDSDGEVVDTMPADCVSPSFSSVADGGASGNTASGTGDIDDTLTLPVGSSVTYTVTCDVSEDAEGTLVNTVTITPSTVADPDTDNNTATDTDQVGIPLFSNGFEDSDTPWASFEPPLI